MQRLRPHAFSLLGLFILACFAFRTLSSPDLWLHLALGRELLQGGLPHTDPLSFSMAGAAWVQTTWLCDAFLFAAWNAGGAALVLVLHATWLLLAYGLMLRAAHRWASGVAPLWALLIAAWLLAPVCSPSPRTFSLLFMALMIWMLETRTPRVTLFALVLLLQVLWTQFDPSFVWGPVIAALFAMARSSDAAAPQRYRWLVLPVACAAATLVNPYGWELHRYLLQVWSDVGSIYVKDWVSPFSWQFDAPWDGRIVTLALLIGAAGLVLHRGPLPLVYTSLAVLSAVVVVLKPRLYQEWFALLSLPFLVLSLRAIGDTCRDVLHRWKPGLLPALLPAGPAAALVLGIASLLLVTTGQYYVYAGSASRFGLGVESDMVPEAAAAVLERPGFPERTINVSVDGGYLAWRLPERKIYVDSRAELYGSGFYQQMADGLSGTQEALRTFEQRWNPDAFVLNSALPGVEETLRALMTSERWALVYFDGLSLVLVRRVDAYADILQDASLQAAGLDILEKDRLQYAQALGSPVRPPNAPRLIGAARIFLNLEQYREAMGIYALLVRGTRTLPAAWLGLSFCQMQLDQPEQAIETLERATRLFRGDARCWLALSWAHEQAGDPLASEQALDRASRLNHAYVARTRNPFSVEQEDAPPPRPTLPFE